MTTLGQFTLTKVLPAIVLLLLCRMSLATETDPEFREAKKNFQQKIRSKAVAERVKVVKNLGQFPVVEGVELVAKFGFADASEAVRVAARAALVQPKDHPEIGKVLLDQLKIASRKDGMTGTTYGVLTVLCSFESEEIDVGVPRYLDDVLGKPKVDPLPLFTLVGTIQQLSAEVRFNVVLFNSQAQAWMPELVPATPDRKQQAIQTVNGASLRAGTASHAALEATFTLDPEAIYFLSDGAPTDGRPQHIVEAISPKNRTRRVSLHTIGIGTDRAEISRLGEFMKSLAEANWGDYRAVGF